jgi:hypothetical protein
MQVRLADATHGDLAQEQGADTVSLLQFPQSQPS